MHCLQLLENPVFGKEESEILEKQIKKELEKVMDQTALDAAFESDVTEEAPFWFDGKSIDEIGYCEHLLSHCPMKCINGMLYDQNGIVDINRLENVIFNEIKPYAFTNVAKVVGKLKDALKIAAYSRELAIDEKHIHFQNGTYSTEDGSFTEEKTFCLNRLPVNYVPDAPKPERWLSFLDELLYPEDIPALQEFMGYTFIPTNRAQVMMLIIGNGGEGKSRIALVLRALHGNNMNMCSLGKLSKDKFSRADQEGKLLMVDDDINIKALEDTSVLKTIVTLESKYDLERKNQQSYQGNLYVRVLALGNGALASLYDKSDGFYRRQLVLQVKPKSEDREDDRNLIDKLKEESEGIMQWCLEGLHRLMDNGFAFTVSERMKTNIEEMKKNDNNIIEFYESTGYIRFEEGTHALSRDLYSAYQKWCADNLENPFSQRTFTSQLKRDEEKLGIRYDKNLDAAGGKKARGYHGVHVTIRPDDGWSY